ncbi:GNAT family N-acetyltransferase [Bacillus sp. JJ1566]|uniref:GNAT family N-acetyltransferase n=1 Tax=Bacillus sp. JJ1566 TaxID=3122961 RepID=UPI002FFF4DA4
MNVRTRIPEQDDAHIIAMGSVIFGIDAGLIENRLKLAEDVLLVCDDQDKIVGFLSYRLKEKTEFFIDMVAFDPYYQGRGIALSFLPTLLDYAKDKGALSIGGIVYKKNERVLKLFKHWGFRIKRYFVDTVYIERVI